MQDVSDAMERETKKGRRDIVINVGHRGFSVRNERKSGNKINKRRRG